MKRFRFPLQAVITLRAHREMRALEVFANSTQALVKTQEQFARQQAQVATIERALAEGRLKAFSPNDQAHALFAYRRECDAESESRRNVQAAEARLEQHRTEYLAARRQLEVIQRLQEKARTAHRHETSRAEQAEMDDFASQRSVRPATSLL